MTSLFHTQVHFLLALFVLFLSSNSFAQSTSNSVFKDQETGISFEIPESWDADFAIGGYSLQSSVDNCYALILPLAIGNEENIFANLNNPVLYSIQGVELYQSSNAYQSAEGFMMSKMQGQLGWKDMLAYACVVQTADHEGFIIIVGSKEAVQSQSCEKLADQLASSLRVKRNSFELLASTF